MKTSFVCFPSLFLPFSLLSSLSFFPFFLVPFSFCPYPPPSLYLFSPVPGVDFGSKLLRLFNDPTQRPAVNFFFFLFSFISCTTISSYLISFSLTTSSPPYPISIQPPHRYAIFVASQQRQQRQQQHNNHNHDSSTTTPFLSPIPTFQFHKPRGKTTQIASDLLRPSYGTQHQLVWALCLVFQI